MKICNENLKQFLLEAGVQIPEETQNIGRDLTYSNDLKRTVVVQFSESDFPAIVRTTLEAVCNISGEWVWVNRFGEKTGINYSTTERSNLIEKLVETWSQLRCVQDDLSLVSGDGMAILSFNHHILDDGMPIYFADIEKTGLLLSKLNEIGAEFEVYSKNG